MTSGSDLGRTLASLETRVARLEAGLKAPQLSHSSVEDTHLPMYDSAGNLRARIGKHTDGSFALTYANGEVPTTPSTPSIIAAELSLIVFFDGLDDAGSALPADTSRVDIHESETAGFTPDGSTIRSSVPPTGGGRLLVLDNQVHYIKLVTVTTSAVPSVPSAEVSKTPLLVSDIDVDSLTGETITGATIRTSDSGRGIVLSAATNDQYFYSADGQLAGIISEFSDAQGGLLEVEGFDVDGNGRVGLLRVTDNRTILGNFESGDTSNSEGSVDIGEGYVRLQKQDPALNGDATSLVYLDDGTIQIIRPVGSNQFLYILDGQYTSLSHDKRTYVRADNGTRVTFFQTDADGYTYLHAYNPLEAVMADKLYFLSNPPGRARLYADGAGTALTFRSFDLICEDLAENPIQISASSFNVVSSSVAKTNIRESGFSALDAVRAAPVYRYNYKGEVAKVADPPQRPPEGSEEPDPGPAPETATEHIGPMAEDLPDSVTDGETVSVNGMVGVLWQAVRELADRGAP